MLQAQHDLCHARLLIDGYNLVMRWTLRCPSWNCWSGYGDGVSKSSMSDTLNTEGPGILLANLGSVPQRLSLAAIIENVKRLQFSAQTEGLTMRTRDMGTEHWAIQLRDFYNSMELSVKGLCLLCCHSGELHNASKCDGIHDGLGRLD